MLNLNKNKYNTFPLYINEDVSISNPFYIFKFTDVYNREVIQTLVDDTSTKEYNTFSFYDGSDFSINHDGIYYVYESTVDTSIIDSSLNLLEYGKYKVIYEETEDVVFDPSINYTDFVWDPCDGGGTINQDTIYDPQWVTGDLPKIGLPHSIVTAIDAVDTSLVTYVDGKVTNVDTSLNGIWTELDNIDTSFGNISIDDLDDVSIGTTLADENVLQYNVDTSTWDNTEVEDATNYFELKTNLDSSFGLYETKVNLDSSFIDVWTELDALDASIIAFEANDVTFDYVDGSIVTAVNAVDTSLVTYVDGKVTNVDTSFGLYETKTNLDSSFGTIWTELDNLDTSFGLYETKTNLDTSFGNISIDNLIDVSIGTTLADENVLQYNVDTSTWDNTPVEDATNYFALTTNIDSSLSDIYTEFDNVDTSFGLYEIKGTNVWYIDASGAGNYTTIQGALDDNPIEQQMFIVNPGTYTDDTINFTADNQCVRSQGCAPKCALVTKATTICDFGAHTGCVVDRIKMVMTCAINTVSTTVTGTGSCNFKYCHVECIVSGTNSDTNGGATCFRGTGTVKIVEGTLIYTNNANRGGRGKKAILVEDGSYWQLDNVNITANASGTSSATAVIRDKSTGGLLIETCDIEITDNDATTTYGLNIDQGMGNPEINRNVIHVYNSSGNAIVVNLGSGGGLLNIRSMYNHYQGIGAGNSYAGQILDASTTVISQFDDLVAADGVNNIAGTYTFINSPEDGNLDISGNVSIGGETTFDGSIILQTSNDASTYWLDVDITGALVANIIS